LEYVSGCKEATRLLKPTEPNGLPRREWVEGRCAPEEASDWKLLVSGRRNASAAAFGGNEMEFEVVSRCS
jgi:hypothetical protein